MAGAPSSSSGAWRDATGPQAARVRDALTREFDALQQGNRLSREDQQLQGVMKAGVVVGACFNFAAARFVAFPLAMRVPLLAARRPYVRGFAYAAAAAASYSTASDFRWTAARATAMAPTPGGEALRGVLRGLAPDSPLAAALLAEAQGVAERVGEAMAAARRGQARAGAADPAAAFPEGLDTPRPRPGAAWTDGRGAAPRAALGGVSSGRDEHGGWGGEGDVRGDDGSGDALDLAAYGFDVDPAAGAEATQEDEGEPAAPARGTRSPPVRRAAAPAGSRAPRWAPATRVPAPQEHGGDDAEADAEDAGDSRPGAARGRASVDEEYESAMHRRRARRGVDDDAGDGARGGR